MSTRNGETTSESVYSIPGFIELEKAFDSIGTVTHNALVNIESYYAYRLRKNVTGNEQEKLVDFQKYALLFLPQEFKLSEVSPITTYWRFPSQEQVTSSARKEIESISNKELAKQAINILDEIERQLRSFDITVLPRIGISELDDGRIIIEWVFEHFRTGFNLELNHDESGYFLISDKSAGEMRESGYLKGLKLGNLIRSKLMLIINN